MSNENPSGSIEEVKETEEVKGVGEVKEVSDEAFNHRYKVYGSPEENKPVGSEQVVSFEDITRLDKLYERLGELGTIKGSLREYTAKELIDLIAKTIENISYLGQITQTGGLRKKILELILAESSKDSEEKSFTGARGFANLYERVAKGGVIAGTLEDYQPSEVADLIKSVRKNELPLRVLPRTRGLRETVARLMVEEAGEEKIT
ncbi:MAG: hypothetical protein NTV48_01160 [Candidatus Vogelbacteria bacterium]|nr:hypothetical protein [Candidatus Vogelbacteria bacterium]